MDQELIQQLVTKIVDRLSHGDIKQQDKAIPIGVSNRHVHLSKEDAAVLFGKGHQLHPLKDLSQPGQYAATEMVIIAGPKGAIDKVRVLGPIRKQTQVEIAQSDCFRLGVNVPVRESGSLNGSGAMTIIGPAGSIQIAEGAIIAKRHLHMTPSDALDFGVANGQIVKVRVPGERGAIFDQVVIRVHEQFALEFHIDIDEANASCIAQGDLGYLVQGSMQVSESNPTPAMKRSEAKLEKVVGLVTEDTVRSAFKRKTRLSIPRTAICTPLARDAIKDLGVEVHWES